MIRIHSLHLQKDPANIQKLASYEPVIIDDNNKIQVLMDYDEFIRLGGKLDIARDKDFISAYDTLYQSMQQHFTDEEAESLANYDYEFDKSAQEVK